MNAEYRDRISGVIDERRQEYTNLSDEIWGYAEPRFQEYESSRAQQEFLKARGFSIRADLAGEKTAFIAEYGSGKPVIAFWVNLMRYPVWSRRQTARSAARFLERKTGMAAVIIFWERHRWRLWML